MAEHCDEEAESMSEFKQNQPNPLMELQKAFGGDGTPNSVLNGDGFYISYHQSTDEQKRKRPAG
jgi:hypothetical protein